MQRPEWKFVTRVYEVHPTAQIPARREALTPPPTRAEALEIIHGFLSTAQDRTPTDQFVYELTIAPVLGALRIMAIADGNPITDQLGGIYPIDELSSSVPDAPILVSKSPYFFVDDGNIESSERGAPQLFLPDGLTKVSVEGPAEYISMRDPLGQYAHSYFDSIGTSPFDISVLKSWAGNAVHQYEIGLDSDEILKPAFSIFVSLVNELAEAHAW